MTPFHCNLLGVNRRSHADVVATSSPLGTILQFSAVELACTSPVLLEHIEAPLCPDFWGLSLDF